jgi:hypothetical protein
MLLLGVLHVEQHVDPGHPGIGTGVVRVDNIAIVAIIPLVVLLSVLMSMVIILGILKHAPIDRADGVTLQFPAALCTYMSRSGFITPKMPEKQGQKAARVCKGISKPRSGVGNHRSRFFNHLRVGAPESDSINPLFASTPDWGLVN